MEFKWYLTIDIKDDDYENASRNLALAQDAFFDYLNSAETSKGDFLEWEVLDEETK